MSRFDRILVANRGEIASRIFRSARAMGLHTVAVYVESDRAAPFVSQADEAIVVPSYLDAPAVVAAADRTGAGAIHPGYGFLAENADFARAVADADLRWIGPSADVIAAMGDKIAAKAVAADVGIPLLPAADDPGGFASLGFPLMVKAAAGGGGKGMRVVSSADELDDAVTSAQREADSSFGDGRLFAERYVPRARHIEVQILGDAFGNLVHLGERECSIQRRHQKVIEESPSPFVGPDLRSDITLAALRLASALGYESAGTIEFIVDADTGEFFFLEVNTRLQVEHPVTEAVTGLDLVREQIRVAMGEPLSYTQDDIDFSGHAIEARLYAEQPANDFLPAIGRIDAFATPTVPPVRWDTGVAEGSIVGVEFDPLLTKAIIAAPTRSEAAAALALALERLHLGGVDTNRDFLAAVLRSDEFLSGDTTTDFIDRVDVPRVRVLDEKSRQRLAEAAALWIQAANRADAVTLADLPSGWRIGRLPPEHIDLELGGQPITMQYRTHRDGAFGLGPDGTRRGVVVSWSAEHIDLEVDGHRTRLQVTRSGARLHLTGAGGGCTATVRPRFHPAEPDRLVGSVHAPMPGRVIEIRVGAGDRVDSGQVLAVLEAMKMENHLRATASGVVGEVCVAEGDQVDKDTLMFVIGEGED